MKKIIIYLIFVSFFMMFISSCKKEENNVLPVDDDPVDTPVQTIKILNPFCLDYRPNSIIEINKIINSDEFKEKLKQVETKYNCKIEFIDFDVTLYSNFPPSPASIILKDDVVLNSYKLDTDIYKLLQERFESGVYKDNEISAIYLPQSNYAFELIKNNSIYDVSDYREDYSSVYYQPNIFKNRLYGFPIISFVNSYYFNYSMYKEIILDSYNDINDIIFDDSEAYRTLQGSSFLFFYFQYLAANNIIFADFNDYKFIDIETFIKTVDTAYELFFNKYAYTTYDYGHEKLSYDPFIPSIWFSDIGGYIDYFRGITSYDSSEGFTQGAWPIVPLLLKEPKWYNEPVELTDIYGDPIVLDQDPIEGYYGIDLSNSDYKTNIQHGDGIFVLNHDLDKIRTKEYTASIINELFPKVSFSINDRINNSIKYILKDVGYDQNNSVFINILKMIIKSLVAKDSVIYDVGPSLFHYLLFDLNIRNNKNNYDFIQYIYKEIPEKVYLDEYTREEFIQRMVVLYTYLKDDFNEIYYNIK